MRKKPAVIAYDITSNKRRGKVFRCLKTWSLDAQYSVFECSLSWREAEELFLQLTSLIDEQEDTLMLAWLDNKREAIAISHATGISFKEASWYLG